MIALLIVFVHISYIFGLPEDGQQQGSTQIPIISQTEVINGADGSYNFSYETGNGIRMEEASYVKKLPILQGRLRDGDNTNNDGNDGDVQVKSGSYSYTAPDGTVISLSYIADENGFQPKGDHLPQVPDYVKRLLNELPQTEPIGEGHRQVRTGEDTVHQNNVRHDDENHDKQDETTTNTNQ